MCVHVILLLQQTIRVKINLFFLNQIHVKKKNYKDLPKPL